MPWQGDALDCPAVPSHACLTCLWLPARPTGMLGPAQAGSHRRTGAHIPPSCALIRIHAHAALCCLRARTTWCLRSRSTRGSAAGRRCRRARASSCPGTGGLGGRHQHGSAPASTTWPLLLHRRLWGNEPHHQGPDVSVWVACMCLAPATVAAAVCKQQKASTHALTDALPLFPIVLPWSSQGLCTWVQAAPPRRPLRRLPLVVDISGVGGPQHRPQVSLACWLALDGRWRQHMSSTLPGVWGVAACYGRVALSVMLDVPCSRMARL